MTNLNSNEVWPFYSEDEIAAVGEVMRSGRVNYWTGDEGRLFEQEFALSCSAKYAVAVANGTVALELALIALGIGRGDEVVVTARSFIASAAAIVMVGARPVFADVDEDSQNITAETIEAVLTERTKAVVAVHLAGWPCEMDEILALAEDRGLYVIEDCAQAHGALYKGRPVGSFGHAAAWSFCQDKIISTGGEGGMLVLQDKEVWKKAWAYKDHGKSWNAVYSSEHHSGYKWLHESFGTNWRLTEMQAAIGRIQLRKLEEWVSRRREYRNILHEACSSSVGLRVSDPPEYVRHSYYKYYCFVRPERLHEDWTRNAIIEKLRYHGVPVMQGVCPEIYREKAFDMAEAKPKQRLPIARQLGETSLMFPVHPTLTNASIRSFCNTITEVMADAVEQ